MVTANDFPTSSDSSQNRVILGLNQPPLISAVEWFFQSFTVPDAGSREWNLADTIVVLPTARGQHRLRQLLLAKAESTGFDLSLPTIVTVGELPEYLYTAHKPLATILVQQLAWSQALSEMDDHDFTLLTSRSPDERPRDWQSLAELISSLHARLSSDIWSFSSVVRSLRLDRGFLRQELVRWEVLERLQQRYYQILAEAGLWDRHAARNYAAGGLLKANEIRCRTEKTIVMLAVADLSRSVAEMLRQVRQQNSEKVKVLIAADHAQSGRFDEFGSLISGRWLNATLEIKDHQIRVVDQPTDQANAVIGFLTEIGDRATDEITIGVPDEEVIPLIERNLKAIGTPCRSLPGKPLIDTAPVKLLTACSNYLTTFSYEALASLVRHPDVYDWLCLKVGTKDWLIHLTEFQNSQLPDQILLDARNPFGDPAEIAVAYDPSDSSSKRRAEAWAQAVGQLNRIHLALCELLGDLNGPKRPMNFWVDRWQQLLMSVYGDRVIDYGNPYDQQILTVIQLFLNSLSNQAKVPQKFQTEMTSIQSLNLSLKEVIDLRVAAPEDPTAIELAGWLDLVLDDAPVMAVTGMNEGTVPTSERGHPFLPNELCKTLKIMDNDRRYARDCYALSVISSVRKDFLLITGRRNAEGEPLKPSRLLFADQAEVAATRAQAFFQFFGNRGNRFWLADPNQAAPKQKFAIPKPQDFQQLTQITVTRFRDYLKCPYRFYLKHVMRLETASDEARELDAGLFGDLAHNCLEEFGKSEYRDSQNQAEIIGFLDDRLNQYATKINTEKSLPAVEIQIAQIRQRFEVFADLQAKRRADGWRIVSTEEMLEHDFEVDGQPFKIRGKIDRIDQHEVTGKIAIWDYKTSDKGEGPAKAHYLPQKKEWKDLQLPLYRHLVKEVDAVADCDLNDLTLGYVILSKRLEEIRFEVAEWNQELLASADVAAQTVIRCLRQSVFWPPTPEPPLYSQEFESICQDTVFEPWLFASSEEDN